MAWAREFGAVGQRLRSEAESPGLEVAAGRGGTGLTRAVPRARELGLRPVADHVGNLVRQALPQLPA